MSPAEAMVYAAAFAKRYEDEFINVGAIDAATRAAEWASECVDAIREATAVTDEAVTALVAFRAFGQEGAKRDG